MCIWHSDKPILEMTAFQIGVLGFKLQFCFQLLIYFMKAEGFHENKLALTAKLLNLMTTNYSNVYDYEEII